MAQWISSSEGPWLCAWPWAAGHLAWPSAPSHGTGTFLQPGSAACPCPVPCPAALEASALGLCRGSSGWVDAPWDGGSVFWVSVSCRAEDGYPHILPSHSQDFFPLTCRHACRMESTVLSGQLIQLLSPAFIGNTKLLCVKNNLSLLDQNHVKRRPCTFVSPGSPVGQILVTQCPAGECGVLLGRITASLQV